MKKQLKIDLLMPVHSRYQVLHHFTKQLAQALQEEGVATRLLETNREHPERFLKIMFDSPPDYTLSFNGILPDKEGHFLCDMIHIPHITYLVDSPYEFLPLIESQNTRIACVDGDAVDFLHGLQYPRAFFLPHGGDVDLEKNVSGKKEYDVVMLASCIDYEFIRESWPDKFTRPVCQALEEAIQIAIQHPHTPHYQVIVKAVNQLSHKNTAINPEEIDFIGLLDELSMFLRGWDRVGLLRSFKDVPIHLFGESAETAGWDKYLKEYPNVIIHESVPFTEALEIMQQTKILLDSVPWIKRGGHERVFNGMIAGAVVATDSNVYLENEFKDGESILFYEPGKWEYLYSKVTHLLQNNADLRAIAKKGQKIALAKHTWKHRAQELIAQLHRIDEGYLSRKNH